MAKTEKKTEEKVEEKVEAPKPIVPATVERLQSAGISLTPYSENNVTEFGNKFLSSLVAAASAEEEAQQMLAAAGEAKQYLGFEMLRAVFDLSKRFEDGKDAIDIYAVFGEAKDVEKLNQRVLIKMGVLKREIGEDDTVQYLWTDETNEKLYSYTKKLKEEDEAEYNKRFNNRKRLNMRLSEAYKAACSLRDAGLSPDDLFYSEDDTGKLVPTIRNAPKQIGGEQGTIQMNVRKPVKGASLSPTMSSLVKLATDKHKEPKADRADKGENREGEAKIGMTDEAFGNIVNTLRRAINAQEGKFTEEMQKQIKNLIPYLQQTIESF